MKTLMRHDVALRIRRSVHKPFRHDDLGAQDAEHCGTNVWSDQDRDVDHAPGLTLALSLPMRRCVEGELMGSR